MRFYSWILGAMAAALLALPVATQAARDDTASTPSSGGIELLVFEVADCVYCALFRRDVLPNYRRWQPARTVPIRFVDARSAGLMRARLAAPLTTVPTFVVMRDGREAGRISGYFGPAPFFQMITRIIRRPE